jgi:hypothetical protein
MVKIAVASTLLDCGPDPESMPQSIATRAGIDLGGWMQKGQGMSMAAWQLIVCFYVVIAALNFVAVYH